MMQVAMDKAQVAVYSLRVVMLVFQVVMDKKQVVKYSILIIHYVVYILRTVIVKTEVVVYSFWNVLFKF